VQSLTDLLYGLRNPSDGLRSVSRHLKMGIRSTSYGDRCTGDGKRSKPGCMVYMSDIDDLERLRSFFRDVRVLAA
jgi:hypothetical protein